MHSTLLCSMDVHEKYCHVLAIDSRGYRIMSNLSNAEVAPKSGEQSTFLGLWHTPPHKT